MPKSIRAGATPDDDLWEFPAKAERAIDGDTLDLLIDQGMHGYRRERFRLLAIDTPELRGEDRALGLAAKGFVIAWIDYANTYPGEWPLFVQTMKADVFGRYLAHVWRRVDWGNLSDALIAAGYAKAEVLGVTE